MRERAAARVRLRQRGHDPPGGARGDRRANVGHAFGYGHDPTHRGARATRSARTSASARGRSSVFNGTAANVLCLRAACRPWQAVICADTAHLNVDECGAPEAIAGVKLLPRRPATGKLTPASVRARLGARSATSTPSSRGSCRSRSAPSSAPCTRSTSSRALADLAHGSGLLLHVDGARLANAAAALGAPAARR